MHARITHFAVVGLLAVVAILSSCGDDDPAGPASSDTPDIELATFQGAGSFQGSERPLGSVTIEFGADSETLPILIPPDTLLFSDREFDDNTSFTARSNNTPNFEGVAANLANGADGTAYARLTTSNGSTMTMAGPESVFFDFAPGVTLTGPDLEGYTVTAIRITVDLEITPVGPQWLLEFDYTITILGH